MVVPRASFNLCFRYKVTENMNQFNKSLRTELYKQGKTLIAYGFIEKKLCLRLLLTHKDMNETVLEDFFKTVIKTGNNLRRHNEQH